MKNPSLSKNRTWGEFLRNEILIRNSQMGKSFSVLKRNSNNKMDSPAPQVQEVEENMKLFLLDHEKTKAPYLADLQVNLGRKVFCKVQHEWRQDIGKNFAQAVEVEEKHVEEIVKGIIKTRSGMTYDLPHNTKLSDMIQICEDIWDTAS